MREILFRGKLIDDYEWVTGSLILHGEYPLIFAVRDFPLGTGMYHVDPATIGQYTGLTDKNGKKIFEGDILKYHEPFVMKAVGVVCYGENQWSGNKNVGFYMKWFIAELPNILRTDLGFWCNDREVEIVGNIYDNPEFLKEVQS